MLNLLRIQNYILIEDVTIMFKNGFTVITGETGSGKSIIIKALSLLLGAKLNTSISSNKSKETVITAIISHDNDSLSEFIKNLGIDLNENLILRRSISKVSNKSKYFINDVLVTSQTMQNIRELLLEVSGQHSTRGLLNSANHINFIDEYINNTNELDNLKQIYEKLVSKKFEFEQLMQKRNNSDIEEEFIKNTINDLQNLNYQIDEEDALILMRSKLADRQKTNEIITNVTSKLSQMNINSQLYSISKDLEKFEIFKDALSALNKSISEIEEFEAQINDILLNHYQDSDIDKIENRLFKIRSTARKYNKTAFELPKFMLQKRQELNEIENLDNNIITKEKELQYLKNNYYMQATLVSDKRTNASSELEDKINQHLKSLMMKNVEVRISCSKSDDENKWKTNGFNKIEFFIKTNNVENFDALSKCASGGELSRIMLAIKLALAQKNSIQIMIFDEIDVGVSGATASAIAKKLSELSLNVQTIVITHHSQIAAYADQHIRISKDLIDDEYYTKVKTLTVKQKQVEIAKMISGDRITTKSQAAANSLMDEASEFKKLFLNNSS